MLNIHKYLMAKNNIDIFRFNKQIFIGLLSICTIPGLGESLVYNPKGPIRCVSLNNQPCQARPTTAKKTLMKLFFIYLVLVLISVVEVVILLMIHMLEFVF